MKSDIDSPVTPLHPKIIAINGILSVCLQKLTDNNVLKSGPILLLIMLITSCGINVEHKQLLYAESLLEFQ